MLNVILRLLFVCECRGIWPDFVSLVIVVLITKSDGGLRPIGLLPFLPRVWMRLRYDVIRRWESSSDMSRSYVYAGPGTGCHFATWKQGVRAELAKLDERAFAMGLLDLVKAFERVNWAVLVREARRCGYPLWLLRLSIAVYRLARVVRVDTAVSCLIFPTRSITAGSVNATAELKCVMIRIVDEGHRYHPTVMASLFVDDLAADHSGDRDDVRSELVGVLDVVCREITADLMEVSPTKCVCIASSKALNAGISTDLAALGWTVRPVDTAKSLGTEMGAGIRRTIQAAQDRLNGFIDRYPRWRALGRAGVSLSRIANTGGTAGLTYGQVVMGVSDSFSASPAKGSLRHVRTWSRSLWPEP